MVYFRFIILLISDGGIIMWARQRGTVLSPKRVWVCRPREVAPIIVLLYYSIDSSIAYGYDSNGDQGACGRQYRSGRLHRPPCDLGGDGYCTSAGAAYPWHAVKRFVRENQGLMRRMYGDQRHSQVLKGELDDEAYLQPLDDDPHSRKMYGRSEFDLNIDNELFPKVTQHNEGRYLREDDISNDDVLNTKFVYSEEPTISIKVVDLKSAPHFRQTTAKTTTSDGATEETTMTTDDDESTVGTTEIGETLEKNSSANHSESEDETEGVGLFQDSDDSDRNEVQVDYQMKGVNACPVKEEVVAPFWANNTRGEILALLNMYPFEQYVHWEKCTHEHRQMYCRDGCRCEQQYRLHRLLAYDPNNECRGIFSDWFRFPSCCVCKCYNIPPAEFRVTSRSPRANPNNDGLPDWYRRKNRAIYSDRG